MTITYEVADGLYLNLTNRCSCDCEFCVRREHDAVGGGGSLWLPREPSYEEIMEDIDNRELSRYSEIVFCGFGEPTMRLDVLLKVAKTIKERFPVKIRVNTNGHASLIAGYDVTPGLHGLVDVLSVSLNYPDAEAYDKHCRPEFGEAAWDGLIDFAKRARSYVPEVIFTVVDVLPPEDIARCREIAKLAGVDYRVRGFITPAPKGEN